MDAVDSYIFNSSTYDWSSIPCTYLSKTYSRSLVVVLVATGRIERGVINSGDPVDILGMGAEGLKSTVTGVEMFSQILDRGEAGDNVGLLLRGI